MAIDYTLRRCVSRCDFATKRGLAFLALGASSGGGSGGHTSQTVLVHHGVVGLPARVRVANLGNQGEDRGLLLESRPRVR
eukprot:1195156-Prorocentrum_minimum.AAC.4